MAQIEVLNPVALSAGSMVDPAKRLDGLAGKTIGLYWNLNPSGDIALAHISEVLSRRFPNIEFKSYVGTVGIARRMTAEQADQIARECQGLIAATGD